MSNRRHQTRRWRLLADRAKARDGWRCRKCGSMKQLEAHHQDRREARWWALESILTLCASCHIDHHRAERRRTIDPAIAAWRNALEELRTS